MGVSIKIKGGDIFRQRVQAIVNPVNCVGVAGKGLALAFKKAYPIANAEYVKACKDGTIGPGRVFVSDVNCNVPYPPKYVIHFPTKRHWRDASRIDDIVSGLADLRRVVVERGISSVAVPALGCGLGGLRWEDVYPAVAEALGDLPSVRVVVLADVSKISAARAQASAR